MSTDCDRNQMLSKANKDMLMNHTCAMLGSITNTQASRVPVWAESVIWCRLGSCLQVDESKQKVIYIAPAS